MKLNSNLIRQIDHLPPEEREAHRELCDVGIKLHKKYGEVRSVDKKIMKITNLAKEIRYEVKHSSMGRKVGYGFAGTASILLCPISWVGGIFFFCASAFSGGRKNSTAEFAQFLFCAPIALTFKLFAKATMSKEKLESHQAEVGRRKIKLTAKRVELFNEVNILDEQMKKQILKMVEMGNCRIPTLLHEAITIGENVKNLTTKRVIAS